MPHQALLFKTESLLTMLTFFSYNVGCTKRTGLFPNRKTSLENMKKQKALKGNHKDYSLDSKKKVRPQPAFHFQCDLFFERIPDFGESEDCHLCVIVQRLQSLKSIECILICLMAFNIQSNHHVTGMYHHILSS